VEREIMAITSSAKKAQRSSLRKRVFNLRRKKAMNDAVLKAKKLASAGKFDEAKKAIELAYKTIDKASKGNTIKKNKASRKKSRLARFVNKIQSKKD